MKHASRIVAIAAFGWTLPSCDASPRHPDRVAYDTIGTTAIVRNDGRGLWSEADRWALVEDFRLGSGKDTSQVVFGDRRLALSWGPQGHLYVLDVQAAEVMQFDHAGRFVRRFGGRGKGPGELAAPGALSWDEQDRLWIPNSFNGRYTVFDTAGRLVKTVPRPLHVTARQVFEMVPLNPTEFMEETAAGRNVTFVSVDTVGRVADTLQSIRRPWITDHSLIGRSVPIAGEYFPRLVWRVARDGTIWAAHSDEMRLVHTDARGDTIRVVERSPTRATLSSAETRMIETDLERSGVDPSGVAIVKPLVQAIYVLPDGYLLVQVVEQVGSDSRMMDVFDPKGRYLGSFQSEFAPNPTEGMAFRGDTVAAVTLGENDVPFVVRATLHRPASRVVPPPA